MKKTLISRLLKAQLVALILALATLKVCAQSIKDPDVIGRWDLTIDHNGKSQPSWLEV